MEDWSGKTIDELKQYLSKLSDGYAMQSYGWGENEIFIRGSIISPNENVVDPSRFSYCPKHLVKTNNRANRAGDTLFYCCTNLRTMFNEVHPKPGDYLYISYWWADRDMHVVPVGYSQEVITKLGSTVDIQTLFADSSFHESQLKDYRTKLYFDEFTRLNIDNPETDYRFSIAIAEQHFAPARLNPKEDNSKYQNVYLDSEGRPLKIMDALMYPSIKSHGHNYAIRPEFVDSAMSLMRVDCFEVMPDEQLKFLKFSNVYGNKPLKWIETDAYKSWAINTPKGPIIILKHDRMFNSYDITNGFYVTDPSKVKPF
ncbi:hypothetical protein [Bdellovibrio sp. HCB209]|uniref:hypothetical protein n=1 Tax=Bdellovibrio sp. HCB209 TaxID=3394354 RepID=UPI0039B55C0B